jgi:hypothetical protein
MLAKLTVGEIKNIAMPLHSQKVSYGNGHNKKGDESF